MRSFLLTSAGLANDKVKKFFIGQIHKLKLKEAYIITAGRIKEERRYIEESKKELVDLGIKVEEINISHDGDLSKLLPKDIYYICGGNTFYILDRIKKTNLDRVLAKAVKQGKFYVGVSAGSIMAGPDIEIAGIGPAGDKNDVKLTDLAGFGFIPFHISPHYDKKSEKRIIEDFSRRKKKPVIAITDDQAVFVSDKEAILIGEGGEFNLAKDYIDESMPFPSNYRKALLKRTKDTTIRIGKEVGKYKTGNTYKAISYTGNDFNIKVKVLDIKHTTLARLENYGIPKGSMNSILKEETVHLNSKVDLIKFKVFKHSEK